MKSYTRMNSSKYVVCSNAVTYSLTKNEFTKTAVARHCPYNENLTCPGKYLFLFDKGAATDVPTPKDRRLG
jgi:hypothetical protein